MHNACMHSPNYRVSDLYIRRGSPYWTLIQVVEYYVQQAQSRHLSAGPRYNDHLLSFLHSALHGMVHANPLPRDMRKCLN
jgi:hypothetical protein